MALWCFNLFQGPFSGGLDHPPCYFSVLREIGGPGFDLGCAAEVLHSMSPWDTDKTTGLQRAIPSSLWTPGSTASVPVEKVLTRPPCTGQVHPTGLTPLGSRKDSCKETLLSESADGETGVQRGQMTYPRPHRRHI